MTISLIAEVSAALDDLLERRDHRLAAVETEALGAGVLDVAKLLERLGLDELAQDRLASFDCEVDALLGPLYALLNPALLRRIGDVRELHADLAAIRAPQNGEDLAHRRRLETHHPIDEDRTVEVSVRKAVCFGQKLAVHAPVGKTQGIEIGGKMADDAIGADQHQRADRILRGA